MDESSAGSEVEVVCVWVVYLLDQSVANATLLENCSLCYKLFFCPFIFCPMYSEASDKKWRDKK